MDTITNQQTINNAHNIPFMMHVFLIIYVFLCIMVKKRYDVYTFVKNKIMYNYSVALAHRVQHKVLKNTVNMKLIRF